VDNRRLSPEQAFRAMQLFLERYYERGGGTGDLVAVLGDMQSMCEDGMPADPAIWTDWLAAIDAVFETIPR